MNTIVGGLIGVCFSAIFTSVVCMSCYMGFGNPNYFPENGETYIGWALTLFGSTAASFALFGLMFDLVRFIHNRS